MSTATGPISTEAPPSAPVNEVSNTRLYLGNLPRNVTKADIETHFRSHGTGEILEIKLMNGFGFIEYKDAMDARDVVPAFHGTPFMGERLTVQFARGARNNRENTYSNHQERAPPRPRRTGHRMTVTGIPNDTSWQDLKDFARRSGLDVVYSETSRSGDGIVDFETAQDLSTAIEKLNSTEFKGKVVTCTASLHTDFAPRDGRNRSRSPIGRGRPYGPPRDDYDRRGPPPLRGGYSPRRDGPGYRDNYRDRSPHRGYYDDRMRYPTPPRRAPIDDYPPPPPRRYDDPYRRDYPPSDPYVNNRGPYDRPPPPRDFPPRDVGYPRDGGYPRDYDRRYW
ncbi:pre-RNA splicing factor [Niveomyces insectorum RCEF 264]|uniref:Pre-RNA splicing factor n=1 Tax=Niveomyces insectorum RCEF 264 TaxID=1081102 RepID=A0A167U2J0_9HYPO|nr:pre-RNA splicing factor [Niveomyces insectorum RCEF 264]